MSRTLTVFSNASPEWNDPTLRKFALRRTEAALYHERENWQIVVHAPNEVEDEDIPPEVRRSVPGVIYSVLIAIEGPAPPSAFSTALRIAKTIAACSVGIVYDPQEGSITTPKGVKRFPAPVGDDSPANEGIVSLSWWFADCQRFREVGCRQLVETIRTRLPEALPRRYGDYEPPQYKLKVHGLEHFVEFLVESPNQFVVWYPHEPVLGVSLTVPDRAGATPQGYRCGWLNIDLNGAMFSSPAWFTELVRFWREVSIIVTPFYAEIRDERAPIKTWWWNGIPSLLPSAIMLGEPYVSLWPAFAANAKLASNGLRYLVAPSSHDTVAKLTPPPPQDLLQPPDRRIEIDPVTGEVLSIYYYSDVRYPPMWPFEGPRS